MLIFKDVKLKPLILDIKSVVVIAIAWIFAVYIELSFVKTGILIAVSAALTAVYDVVSVLPKPEEETVLVEESDQSFTKDYDLERITGRVVSDYERILFYEESVDLPAIPNTVQTRTVSYRPNSTIYINRISMSNMPHGPGYTHIQNSWSASQMFANARVGRLSRYNA